jgi:hypothetical protein
MSLVVAIEPIVQKDVADCGIASLAMLLGRPYQEVSKVALAIVSKKVHKRGLWSTEVKRIAKALDIRLRVRRKLRDEATGLLVLKRPGEAHIAVLFQGVVINPADGLVWDYDAYLAKGCWIFHSLMEIDR